MPYGPFLPKGFALFCLELLLHARLCIGRALTAPWRAGPVCAFLELEYLYLYNGNSDHVIMARPLLRGLCGDQMS